MINPSLTVLPWLKQQTWIFSNKLKKFHFVAKSCFEKTCLFFNRQPGSAFVWPSLRSIELSRSRIKKCKIYPDVEFSIWDPSVGSRIQLWLNLILVNTFHAIIFTLMLFPNTFSKHTENLHSFLVNNFLFWCESGIQTSDLFLLYFAGPLSFPLCYD